METHFSFLVQNSGQDFSLSSIVFQVDDQQRTDMKLRFKDLYAIVLLTTGLLLISFHHFNSSASDNAITTSLCKTSSTNNDAKGQECISPDEEDQVDQELASYPWIGDPTCQHFAVQV